jgi:hypothetical protein
VQCGGALAEIISGSAVSFLQSGGNPFAHGRSWRASIGSAGIGGCRQKLLQTPYFHVFSATFVAAISLPGWIRFPWKAILQLVWRLGFKAIDGLVLECCTAT